MFALHFIRGMHPELFQENVSGRKGGKYYELHRNLVTGGLLVRLELA